MTREKHYPDIIIDQMQQDDLQQVMAIEEEAFPDPWHISIFKQELRNKNRSKRHIHLYVARLDSKVIGYIVYYILRREGHIMNIAVASKYRRRGIAKNLIAFALDNIQKQEADGVFLEVAITNTPALQLYRQFGFEICSVRKRYYRNGVDAYVLRKEIKN